MLKVLKTEPQPQPEVIDVLKSVLERAEKGEVAEVIVVCNGRRAMDFSYSVTNPIEMAGYVSLAVLPLLQSMLGDDDAG